MTSATEAVSAVEDSAEVAGIAGETYASELGLNLMLTLLMQ